MMDVAHCEKCGSDSGVYDSRMSPKGFIRRMRKCVSCGFRWTTYEVREDPEFRQALAILSSYFPKHTIRRSLSAQSTTL
jgi:transcriptional regulator NrdR family protein